MVASNSLQPVLEYCVPQDVGLHPLLRIDLDSLGWDFKDFQRVLRDYPYDKGAQKGIVPLVIRADWLLLQLSDNQESDAGRRLTFGKAFRKRFGQAKAKDEKEKQEKQKAPDDSRIPTKRDELLTILGVGNKRILTYGFIESDSGVSKQRVRLLESRPIERGYAWGTRDALQLKKGNDPLEALDGNYKHDGEEWIVMIPKISLVDSTRGTLMVSFLADGKGNLVNRAPVDLVEDKTKFRGYCEIRNSGSCIQCHGKGYNMPTFNDYADFLNRGGQRSTDLTNLAAIDAYYGSEIRTELGRANEDYARAVFGLTGLNDPEEAAQAFERCINRYDTPLDLVVSARELDVSPIVWKHSIALGGVDNGARIVGLALGRVISRPAWEEQFLDAARAARRFEQGITFDKEIHHAVYEKFPADPDDPSQSVSQN